MHFIDSLRSNAWLRSPQFKGEIIWQIMILGMNVKQVHWSNYCWFANKNHALWMCEIIPIKSAANVKKRMHSVQNLRCRRIKTSNNEQEIRMKAKNENKTHEIKHLLRASTWEPKKCTTKQQRKKNHRKFNVQWCMRDRILANLRASDLWRKINEIIEQRNGKAKANFDSLHATSFGGWRQRNNNSAYLRYWIHLIVWCV